MKKIILTLLLLLTHELSKKIIISDDMPKILEAIPPFLSESCLFFAIGIISYIVLLEIIEKAIFPFVKKEVILPLNVGLGELQISIIDAIKDKPWVLQTDPSTFENIGDQFTKKYLLESKHENSKDEVLIEAKEHLFHGEYTQAIHLLEDVSEKNDDQLECLLTAYVSETLEGYWKKAESILDDFPRPYPYIRLAFNYWEKNYISKAIALSEKALGIIEKNPEYKGYLSSCTNSLAYYYTDGEIKEMAGYARDLIDKAIEDLEVKKSLTHANYLDTLGYIKITFSETKEGVKEGMKDCTQAKEMGADEYLFHRHFSRGHKRLTFIPKKR